MFYTVYRITNKINNKTYIGKHQTKNLSDRYMGSGKLLKRAIQKYGVENFEKEILFVFDNEEQMNQKEKELVIISEDTYNLHEGGNGGFSFINQRKLNNKNRNDTTRRTTLSATRKKMCAANTQEIEHMKNISEIGRGKVREKYPNGTFYGKTHTPETIEKMRLSVGNRNGANNSQYGTCWITNGYENKKIRKDDLDFWMSEGYHRGRILEMGNP